MLHVTSGLHPGQEDKVTLVEILSLITVPVVGGTIDLFHQQVCGSVGLRVVLCRKPGARVFSPQNTRDGVLLEVSANIVATVFILRHGGDMATFQPFQTSLLCELPAKFLVPVTHLEVRYFQSLMPKKWYNL